MLVVLYFAFQGALFLFFAGRVKEIRGNINEVTSFYIL